MQLKYLMTRPCGLILRRFFNTSYNTNRSTECDDIELSPMKCKTKSLTEPSYIDPCKTTPCVVIIGAGMAGLSAAHHLIEGGIDTITVLEASERAGGRIHSNWIGDGVAEMGAHYIDGGSILNPVFSLGAKEGVLTAPLLRPDTNGEIFCTSDGRVIESSLSVTAYHAFRQIEQRAAELYHKSCKKREHGTLLNFMYIRIQQELLNFPEEQRYDASRIMYGMFNCMRCRCGDDLSLVSADNFGSSIEIPGGSILVPSGYTGVLTPLLRDIAFDALHYNKPVESIRWGAKSKSGPRAFVRCCDGDEYPADYVILTMSLGVLKKHAETFFCPNLPSYKMQAIKKLGFGRVNKLFLQYNKPFWVYREGGIKLAWSEEELADRSEWIKGLCTFEEIAKSKTVLCAWIAGPEAAIMESCSDEEIASTITRTLRKFTGDPLLPYPSSVLRSKWCTNPNFLGSYSYLGTEATIDHQFDLGCPLADRSSDSKSDIPILLFAGEATCIGHHASAHGARMSGIREAKRILDLTKKMDGPPVSVC